jgi:hypothetical protein
MCMVRIKHTSHPINISVPSDVESMASDEALENFAHQKEASTEATLTVLKSLTVKASLAVLRIARLPLTVPGA